MSKKKATKSRTGRAATGAKSTRSASPMDLSLLERIVTLMSANDLSMIEVQDGDRRVILKRGQLETGQAAPATPVTSPAPASAAPPAPAAPEPAEESNLVPIRSPMVGTFYSSSSPDAAPFVSVGSAVDEETDVCIIEAMKVFNNIKAECRGTVEKVLVQNGQTVEFGQVLFLVKPG